LWVFFFGGGGFWVLACADTGARTPLGVYSFGPRLLLPMLEIKFYSFTGKTLLSRVAVWLGAWVVRIRIKANSVQLKLKLQTGTELGIILGLMKQKFVL
jgi:hypothetical protein